MKPLEVLATAISPDGAQFELQRHDGNFVIRGDGYDLMTSYAHSSEDAMMSLACPKPPANACVLVGGLGMGYTAAAALALMPRRGKVVVAEIMPEVVEWNRGLLGPLAGHPLDDPRTELVLGDVANVIRGSESRFDAILLDVDNSVDSFSLAHNVWLYTTAGLEAAHRALRPGGTLAIWSVGTDATFERMLRKHGFTASTHPIRERNKRGGHFSVLLGRRD
jgi:spermidine synthase